MPHTETPNPKQAVDALIAEGRSAEALALLREFYFEAPTQASAGFVLSRMAKLAHLQPSRISARLAVLRSFTVEPAVTLLRAYASLYGVDLEARLGEFNAYAQELLSPVSWLSEFEPNIVLIAAQTRDLLPRIWEGSGEPAGYDDAGDRALAELRGYIQAFRNRSSASVVVQMLELPGYAAGGVLDSQAGRSGVGASIARFNSGLRDIAAEFKGVYLLDYDALVARHGRERWHDEQKWLTMRMPIAADCLPMLAQEYLRFVLPLTGKVCKALVCDLDNTLWGGVIGEDGMTGIKLDGEYPGAAYQALQQAVLNLSRRGIILGVASKNNASDALQAMDEHPNMLLRSRDFSAMRINWNDKAHNLRDIARELNIGIDAVAFIDDNPVERRRIQTELPEVCVIDLPDDPLRYVGALRDCPVFERLALSAEDADRSRMYADQRQRTELETSSGTLEEFYASLRQMLQVAPVSAFSLARVAQLTQKTNQFNTTTLRCGEAEIAALAEDPQAEVLSFSVADRFGDNGIVAVAILRYGGNECEIVDLLMSCRVIGRKVETAILAILMKRARARRGSDTIWGWFIPTAKNAPASAVYAEHGFSTFSPGDGAFKDGRSAWRRSLVEKLLPVPDFIRVVGSDAPAASQQTLAAA